MELNNVSFILFNKMYMAIVWVLLHFCIPETKHIKEKFKWYFFLLKIEIYQSFWFYHLTGKKVLR